MGDGVDAMNKYMNRVALTTFGSFDVGKNPPKKKNQNVFIMDLHLEEKKC